MDYDAVATFASPRPAGTPLPEVVGAGPAIRISACGGRATWCASTAATRTSRWRTRPGSGRSTCPTSSRMA